jgi:glycine dehydrogenase
MPFARRHIGPSPVDQAAMLDVVGAPSLDALVADIIPAGIRLELPLALPPGETEHGYLARMGTLARRNKVFRSYIGLGYHDTVTPSVIKRMVMENPGWYTPYTPYQSEIAQGRLEALLTFQTMVADLTAMDIANASLLDDATAAAEAMALLLRVRKAPMPPGVAPVLLVSDGCLPQTWAVLQSRAEPLGIELRRQPIDAMTFDAGGADKSVFGALVQSPDADGCLLDLRPLIERAHAAGAGVAVSTDLLSLAIVTPPGEMGADVVFGTSQRFGVPLGYGGPHAAFFATRQAHVRHLPGRLIGVSVDAQGHQAYRMALATREQHIRREKATSNICTAQALLASMAAMYAVYHGPEGLRAIASGIHGHATALESALAGRGIRQLNAAYFDTLRLELPGGVDAVRAAALDAGLNFHYPDATHIGISLDETVSSADVDVIVGVFEAAGHLGPVAGAGVTARIPPSLGRTTAFMTHEVFNTHRSESQMLRFLRRLERKDLGLDTSMIPLGSCTMKLNAATEMIPVTWEHFGRLHPFAPAEQVEGYKRIFQELETALCVVTGFAAVSLQPNSGAQGEFAGLLVIRAYHRSRGDHGRTVVLIPASAHGTNPASAALAGMRVVVVANAPDGSVDVDDLRRKAEEHAAALSCLMITYPSTHGVFEDSVQQICGIVHAHGGLVYMDGANMNAQVGLTSPAHIGADVCHLNLHKTFAIPHGGGGPGMGPIGVTAALAPFLPGHPLVPVGGSRAITAVSAAPWGSASVLLVSHAYVSLLGGDGMTAATKVALLNANYIKARLEPHYPVLYAGRNGRVAHELIFDLRGFKSGGVDEMDVAKRLIDYGFHAPTVSFPVAGTLMVEPTESEDRGELDRFCDAMIQIRREIDDVVSGRADRADNVLTQAPHTAAVVTASAWTHPYTREEAAYPLPFVRAHKFWPAVGRVDNTYGDRNLACSCPPIEAYV